MAKFIQSGLSERTELDKMNSRAPYFVDRRPPHHVHINNGHFMKSDYLEPYYGEIKNGRAVNYQANGLWGVPSKPAGKPLNEKMLDVSPDASMLGAKEIKIVTGSEPKPEDLVMDEHSENVQRAKDESPANIVDSSNKKLDFAALRAKAKAKKEVSEK